MKRVLIVDDDPDVRLLVSAVFTSKGWDVDEAAGPSEALARAPFPYETIVLDHKMPTMTGDEVAVRIIEAGYTGTIIFFSAYVGKELEGRLLEQAGDQIRIVPKTEFGALRQIIDELSRQ